MDWSENNLCIKCNKGGNVLLCNGKGCPLAVHERCLGCPARLDDAERFFCPYCGYTQAVAELRKAKECVLARKKALLIFMGGSEIDMEENKTFADDGESKSKNDGIIDRPYLLGQDGKNGKTEEDSESSAGSEGEDPSLKMNGENGNGTVEGKQIQEEKREASVEKKNIQEEEHEASVEKENIQEEREVSAEKENNTEEEREVSVEKENTIQEEECEASVEKENIQEEERETSVEEENIHEEGREASVEEVNVEEEGREASVEEVNVEEEGREASVEEVNVEEEGHEASVEEVNVEEEGREASVEEVNVEEEGREASVEDESIQEVDCGTSFASTNRDPSLNGGARAKRGSKRSKPMDKEPETVSAQSKFRKRHDKKKQASTTSTPTKRSTRISSSAVGTGKVVREEFASPTSLRKHEKPSEKSDTFSSGKRRKVVWMEEEVEALREGAKKYMDEGKIPWKKILEESNKFDPTRTPNDLKSRWRIVKFA